MNNSSSNIFYIWPLMLERYQQNYQAVLAATGMIGKPLIELRIPSIPQRSKPLLTSQTLQDLLTIMLLVANLANTQRCKILKTD